MGICFRALVLASCLLSVPAFAADQQFDLVCQGEYHERINAKWKPFNTRLRLDLSTKSWCRDACKEVMPIAAVDTGKITFSKSDPGDGISPYSFQEVDRVSGSFRSYSNGGGSFWDEKATCTAAPFSGFPAAKF